MAEKKFEDSLKRLEEITQKIETGELSLEESLAMFEEGMKLADLCGKKLEEARQKVEILMKKENGSLTATPYEGAKSSRKT